MSFNEYLEKARRGSTFNYKTGPQKRDNPEGPVIGNVRRTNRQYTSRGTHVAPPVKGEGLMSQPKNPGSRGGKGFYNERGMWRYGTAPLKGMTPGKDEWTTTPKHPPMEPHEAMIDDALFRWYHSHPKYKGTDINRHLAYASQNDIIEMVSALHEGLNSHADHSTETPYAARPESKIASRLAQLQRYAKIHAGYRYEKPSSTPHTSQFEWPNPPGTMSANKALEENIAHEKKPFKYDAPSGSVDSFPEKERAKYKSFKEFSIPKKKVLLRKAGNFTKLRIKGTQANTIKAPGSKGGIGYWNGKGEWVYGVANPSAYSGDRSLAVTPTIDRPKADPEAETERLLTKSKDPWTFISGHHKTRTPEDNEVMHSNLMADITHRGYHPMRVTGYYTYQPDGTTPGGVSEEPSYLIPNMGTKEAIELGHLYNQEAVLTHEGMFNVEEPTMFKVNDKKFIRGEIAKDQDQSVIEQDNGKKSTFLINPDWKNPTAAPSKYYPHLNGLDKSLLRKSGLSRAAKYMIAAEIVWLNDKDKKKKKKKDGVQTISK